MDRHARRKLSREQARAALLGEEASRYELRHPPATRQEARDRLLGLSRRPEAGGLLRLARLNPVVTLAAALATGFLMAASLSFRNLGYALLGRLLTKVL